MVLKYAAQRLTLFILIMFVVSVFVCYLVHLLPGNLCVVLLGTGDTPAACTKELAKFGYNQPLYEQYFVWMGHILSGNFGVSPVTDVSVGSVISAALPIDLELIALSQLLALLIAIPAAMYSARKPNGFLDRFATSGALVLLSIPVFVSLPFLQELISIKWQWIYAAPGYWTQGYSDIDNFLALVLPATVIALGSWVLYFRVLKVELITTFQEDFITLARAKGLTKRRTSWVHALRPSSLPLITTVGLATGGLVGGLFIVEFLCAIPGLGYEFLQAIGQSDYITIQGIVLTMATIFVVLLFLVDFAFAMLDPRTKR